MACCCGFSSEEESHGADDADEYDFDVPTDMGISVTSSDAVKREHEALMGPMARGFGGEPSRQRTSVDLAAVGGGGNAGSVARKNHRTRVNARASIIQGIFGGITNGILAVQRTAPLPLQKRASLFVTPGMAGTRYEALEEGEAPERAGVDAPPAILGRGSIQGIQVDRVVRGSSGPGLSMAPLGRHADRATVQVCIRPGFYFDKEELDMSTALAGKEHGCQDLVILIDDLEAFADLQLGKQGSGESAASPIASPPPTKEDLARGGGQGEPTPPAPSPFLLCGVLDGHGQHGQVLVDWVKNVLPVLLARERKLLSDPPHALTQAFLKCQQGLAHVSRCGVDAMYSGTTASVALVRDGAVYCANVGDSRGVLVRRDPFSGHVSAMDLTKDHALTDAAERALVEASGAAQVRQLTLEDPHGLAEPVSIGPHRVFEGASNLPGLAMSRSLGDLCAHSLGVTAQPSIFEHVVQDEDVLLVLATDGVWEYFTSDDVAHFCWDYLERVNRDADASAPKPGKAAKAARGSSSVAEGLAAALSREAQVRWMQDENEEGLVSIDDTGVAIILLKQEFKDALGPSTACRVGDNERSLWRPRKSETVASISDSIYAYLVKQRNSDVDPHDAEIDHRCSRGDDNNNDNDDGLGDDVVVPPGLALHAAA